MSLLQNPHSQRNTPHLQALSRRRPLPNTLTPSSTHHAHKPYLVNVLTPKTSLSVQHTTFASSTPTTSLSPNTHPQFNTPHSRALPQQRLYPKTLTLSSTHHTCKPYPVNVFTPKASVQHTTLASSIPTRSLPPKPQFNTPQLQALSRLRLYP